MQSQVEEEFSYYYERWLALLQTHLHQLLSVSRDPSHEHQHKVLVSRVLSLYKEYYTVKWAGAHEDVLGFFTSSWLTPYEKAYEWVTGWKPSSGYKLIDSYKQSRGPVKREFESPLTSSLASLSEKQVMKIEMLRVKTCVEEQIVERVLERRNMSVADRKMMGIAKVERETMKGIVDGAAAVDLLVGELENVMKAADCVRLRAMKGVLDVLTPVQCVEYMATLLLLQIQLRNWGKRRVRAIRLNQVT